MKLREELLLMDDHYLFTRGGCFVLADEIARTTGWQRIAVRRHGRPVHAAVRKGHCYLDIEGWHTRRELLRRWDAHSTKPIDEDGWKNMWILPTRMTFTGYRKLRERAGQVMPELLEGTR